MRLALFGVIASVLAACGTPCVAQTPRPTTQQLGRCADDADVATCVLHVLSGSLTSRQYADRVEFINAPALASSLDQSRKKAVGDTALGKAFEAASLGPMRAAEIAATEALEDDRAGVAAAVALAPIKLLARDLRPQSLMLGQITTPAGSDVRRHAYWSVWLGYRASLQSKHPENKPASKQLALAALQEYERALGDTKPVWNLAEAYIQIGDRPSVERLRNRAPEIIARFELPDSLKIGELSRAAALAKFESPNPYVNALRRQTLEKLIANRRDDLALELAQAMLRSEPAYAIPMLARIDQKAARTATEMYDRKARALNAEGALSAAAAVAGWTALGERSRADQLVDLWVVPALAQRGQTCGGQVAALCYSGYATQILRRSDRLEEAFQFQTFRADDAIKYDVEDGRGLARLDNFLSREAHIPYREMALKNCVDVLVALRRIPEAEKCGETLMATAGNRQLSSEEVSRNKSPISDAYGGPYKAAEGGFALADAYTKAGDTAKGWIWLIRSLRVLTVAPDHRWGNTFSSFAIENVIIVSLRESGRL